MKVPSLLRRPTLPLIFAALGLPERAHAVGIRFQHQDAAAIARGNAFVATADNPSAVYYNPAGITQFDRQNFELNAFVVGYDVQYESKDGRLADTPDRVQEVGQLFYSAALKASRLFFGLGVYAPYGLASTWNDGTPFRSFSTEAKLIYVSVNPVLAWKISDSLSVGAGVRIDAAHIDLRRGILAAHDEFQFDGDGVDIGFNLGILWQPHPQHSFGMRFFSATSIDFEGRVEIHSETPLLFPSSREHARVDIDFPYHIAGGYSFRPTPQWNLEADIDWTDWDSVNSSTVRKKSGNIVQVFDWQSSFIYSAGVTRSFDNGFSLSAGYSYIGNSSPDKTYLPGVPDMNFHVGSIGARYVTENWTLGLTYQFGYGERDTENSIPSPVGETVDGHYRFISHAIAVTLGARF